jgi:hypothetical protein
MRTVSHFNAFASAATAACSMTVKISGTIDLAAYGHGLRLFSFDTALIVTISSGDGHLSAK